MVSCDEVINYQGYVGADGFRASLNKCFAGLNTKLSQFIVILLTILFQKGHDSVDVIA